MQLLSYTERVLISSKLSNFIKLQILSHRTTRLGDLWWWWRCLVAYTVCRVCGCGTRWAVMRGVCERLRCSSSSSSAGRAVHWAGAAVSVLVVCRSSSARTRWRRLHVAPQLMVSPRTASSASCATVGQLLCLEQLLVLGDAQSLTVDHARALRPRPAVK